MIHNPAGLYGGGAFLVDTRPILNLIAKKQAQDEAKKTALTKYFTDLADKATSTGIRNQEVPAYAQSVDNYKTYWLKNSQDILNGDLAKQMEAERLAKQPLKIAAESKNLRTTDLEVGKATLGNNDIKSTWTDNTRGAWNKHEQPKYIVSGTGEVIENPNHEALDITTMTFNPKLLSESEMQDKSDKQIDHIKPEPLGLPVIAPHPTDKYQQIETTTKGLTKDKLLASGESLRELYKDPSVSYTFEKRHPLSDMNEGKIADLSAANALYKQLYGKDIPENNAEELYVATNLYRKSLPIKEEKLAANTTYIEAQREKAKIREENRAAAKKGGEEVVDINQYLPGIDSVEDGTYSTEAGGTVLAKSGRWYNPDGTIYKGGSAVIVPDLPTEVTKKLPTESFKSLAVIKGGKFTIKDGVTQSIKTRSKGGTMSRIDFLTDAERKKLMNKVPKTENIKVPSTPKQKGGISIPGLIKP